MQSNIGDFLIRDAPPTESLQSLAVRVMNLNFASIHTSFVAPLPLPSPQPLTPSHSSVFICQALFELASLPPSNLDTIRAEITHALEVEGGWNKHALARFHKIDSVLKEVGRMYGLSRSTYATPSNSHLPYQSLASHPNLNATVGLGRFTMHPALLPSGIIVPAGYKVGINVKAIHRNPDIYPNPDVFDPFRFSRMRDDKEGDVKLEFTTVDRNVSGAFLDIGWG
jgi:hypothetical protein